jgi:hypothetical protein
MQLVLVCAMTAAWVIPVAAKDKKTATPPQDRIDVLANLRVPEAPIVRLTMTQHYNRSYLYIEQATRGLTLVDVTDAKHPAIVSSLGNSNIGNGTVLAAAGDAALISSEEPPASPKEKTMTIVSFADRAHPQTIRQFNKVTCTAVDNQRGLIYVANHEGLWILHRNAAEDPELQERYAHDVIYNH